MMWRSACLGDVRRVTSGRGYLCVVVVFFAAAGCAATGAAAFRTNATSGDSARGSKRPQERAKETEGCSRSTAPSGAETKPVRDVPNPSRESPRGGVGEQRKPTKKPRFRLRRRLPDFLKDEHRRRKREERRNRRPHWAHGSGRHRVRRVRERSAIANRPTGDEPYHAGANRSLRAPRARAPRQCREAAVS